IARTLREATRLLPAHLLRRGDAAGDDESATLRPSALSRPTSATAARSTAAAAGSRSSTGECAIGTDCFLFEDFGHCRTFCSTDADCAIMGPGSRCIVLTEGLGTGA